MKKKIKEKIKIKKFEKVRILELHQDLSQEPSIKERHNKHNRNQGK